MSKRYQGNIISASPVEPSGSYENSTASGVWSLTEQNALIGADEWPKAGNVVPGQQAFTTVGTFTWVAPASVTSVSVVAVGGGAGARNGSPNYQNGGGGGLGYTNSITVVPGTSYTVEVGDGGAFASAGTVGDDSYFIDTSTVKGGGGGLPTGGSYTGDGGGTGGSAGNTSIHNTSGGAGGAGGYSGAGGSGASANGNNNGNAGSGGGGGGGGAASNGFSAGGGGVGILGEGTSGAGGGYTFGTGLSGGKGGSGGTDGSDLASGKTTPGVYGGGGGRQKSGGQGAVRIIWGQGRAFPSTRTADE